MKFSIFNFQFSNLLPITFIAFVSFATPILAQGAGLVPCGGVGEPSCQLCDFFTLLNNVINFLFKLAPAVAAAMFIFAGLKFFMAIENPKEVEEAKKVMISVIIGLVILYSAWALVGLFLHTIGLADWTKNIFINWWTNGLFQINCPTPVPAP